MRKGARDGSLKNFKKVLSKRGEPHIRKVRKEDFAALLSIEEMCFKEETFNKKQLRYILFKAKSAVMVAVLEDKIIGSIIILLRNHISNARIYSLNVHPAHRRAGVASLLMDAALKFLKEKGYKKITLEVGFNNKAAQNLYRSKGFIVDKILYNYYKNGDDAFHVFRKL
ncbi:MAG: N-acetyltransferase [Candidatus Methanoperedens sp.]|nr:N-acetyltransferase [Candidatus Methanoperedens sp.]